MGKTATAIRIAASGATNRNAERSSYVRAARSRESSVTLAVIQRASVAGISALLLQFGPLRRRRIQCLFDRDLAHDRLLPRGAVGIVPFAEPRRYDVLLPGQRLLLTDQIDVAVSGVTGSYFGIAEQGFDAESRANVLEHH